MERNIECVFGPHKKPPQLSPLLCLLYLAYTTEPIYGHIYERFSLCAQTRKLLALCHEGQRLKANIFTRAINKMLGCCWLRYKRESNICVCCKRILTSTKQWTQKIFNSLWPWRKHVWGHSSVDAVEGVSYLEEGEAQAACKQSLSHFPLALYCVQINTTDVQKVLFSQIEGRFVLQNARQIDFSVPVLFMLWHVWFFGVFNFTQEF